MNKHKNDRGYRNELGVRGEDAAAEAVRERGMVILKRNYAVHNVGELDIVAEQNGEIHIFEVRARLNIGTYPESEESVGRDKQRKVMRTAECFIDEEGLYDRNVVFEVIKVTHDEQGNILGIEFVPF